MDVNYLKLIPMPKVLTIKDLNDLDDEELASVIELRNPVKLQDEAPKAA